MPTPAVGAGRRAVLAALLLGERPGTRSLLAAVAAAAGVSMVVLKARPCGILRRRVSRPCSRP
ncbi:hypothetical protein ACGF5F_09125 [Streptomyces sp. NPDC047821]|uniref:hypothetical protein n=1 Tax=Streptomyces sp. NPDC047821 TaxID=3365488 RepID=UPI00371C27FC